MQPTIIDAGWCHGLYWIMVDGGTCRIHTIKWFWGPLGAIDLISQCVVSRDCSLAAKLA